MSRLLKFFICLLLLAGGALFLALPYLFPDPSVQECNSMNYTIYSSFFSYDSYTYRPYKNCITSVAVIKGDGSICTYLLDYYKSQCQNTVANTKRTVSWELKQTIKEDDYNFRSSYAESIFERCALDGLISTEVRYYKDYLDADISYKDRKFANDCESILKNANESLCMDNQTIDPYYADRCVERIRLVNSSTSVEDVCPSYDSSCYNDYALLRDDSSFCTGYEKDTCQLTFAIQLNKPEMCNKIDAEYDYYDSFSPKTNCWFYFALKNSDIKYCDNISGNNRYYCRAMLLAEQGSQG